MKTSSYIVPRGPRFLYDKGNSATKLLRETLRYANTVSAPLWHGLRQESRASAGAVWGTTGGRNALRYGRSALTAADLERFRQKHRLKMRTFNLMVGYTGGIVWRGRLPIWLAIRLDELRTNPRAYRSAYESARRGYVWKGKADLIRYIEAFYPWEWW